MSALQSTHISVKVKVKVKVKFTLEQATKARRWSRGVRYYPLQFQIKNKFYYEYNNSNLLPHRPIT